MCVCALHILDWEFLGISQRRKLQIHGMDIFWAMGKEGIPLFVSIPQSFIEAAPFSGGLFIAPGGLQLEMVLLDVMFAPNTMVCNDLFTSTTSVHDDLQSRICLSVYSTVAWSVSCALNNVCQVENAVLPRKELSKVGSQGLAKHT